MELRGVLWALARICEFHLRLRLSLEHPHNYFNRLFEASSSPGATASK